MKKLFYLALALVLVMSLSACGQDQPAQTQPNTPTGSLPVGTTGSTPATTVPITTVPATTEKKPLSIESISEFSFTVCGKEFHLGMKMSELLASGVFTDVEYYEESLEPISSGGAFINLGTDKKCTLTIYLWNLSRNAIDAKDATVVGVSYNPEKWTDDAKAKMGDVTFRGIKMNSSIETLTEVFGKPNVHEYTYDGEEDRSASWRGFDIGEEFRLYIRIIHLKSLPEEQSMSSFSLQFKPFTDSIP